MIRLYHFEGREMSSSSAPDQKEASKPKKPTIGCYECGNTDMIWDCPRCYKQLSCEKHNCQNGCGRIFCDEDIKEHRGHLPCPQCKNKTCISQFCFEKNKCYKCAIITAGHDPREWLKNN